MRLEIKRIEAAAGKINPVFLNSPHYVCDSISRALGCRIVWKVETIFAWKPLFPHDLEALRPAGQSPRHAQPFQDAKRRHQQYL